MTNTPLHNGGWIGVDLDGTLAEYHGWQGIAHIGRPIPKMVARVKAWISRGFTVKIMTARMAARPSEQVAFLFALDRWCLRAGLPWLEATNAKDFQMISLWDDRAVQVMENTGDPVVPGASALVPKWDPIDDAKLN